MAKGNRRSMASMFASAVASQTDDTIDSLKAEIESLKEQTETISNVIQTSNIVPLQLPDNLKQPRRYFASEALDKLKASIAQYGVLEPILVRPSSQGAYEIISGERRWRCCKALGIEQIPAVAREMNNEMALEAALIAHLLSEDISPIEETDSILGLISLKLHQPIDSIPVLLTKIANAQQRDKQDVLEELAEAIASIEAVLNSFKIKISSFVKNRLPLLNLSSEVLEAVRNGELSPTNAKLINRQPEQMHTQLIEQSSGLSKNEVMALIQQQPSESLAQDIAPASPHTNTAQEEEPVHTVVFSRIKRLQRKSLQGQVVSNSKIQTRLRHIQSLLDEIDGLITS